MSWYIVVKTIKGHRYRYRQRTWREGGRMRTESVYLGRDMGTGPTPSDEKPVSGVGDGAALIDTTELSAHIAGEPAFIASLFEPANKAVTWEKGWSRRYSAKSRRVVPDPRVFKVAMAMGIVGTTRAWVGEDGEDGAWHMPARNRIQMPDHSRFVSAAAFHKTFLHELAHATKAASRVDRRPRGAMQSFRASSAAVSAGRPGGSRGLSTAACVAARRSRPG